VQPDATTKAQEREDILNIGGFSDRVFDVIAVNANGETTQVREEMWLANNWSG